MVAQLDAGDITAARKGAAALRQLADELLTESPFCCPWCQRALLPTRAGLIAHVEACAAGSQLEEQAAELSGEVPWVVIHEGREVLAEVLEVAETLHRIFQRWRQYGGATETVLRQLAGDDDDELRWALYTLMPESAIGQILGGLAATIDDLNGGTGSPLSLEQMRTIAAAHDVGRSTGEHPVFHADD